MKLLFDIETNGLPRQGLDHIHCIVIKDMIPNKPTALMTLASVIL
jgi:hypothetical protein